MSTGPTEPEVVDRRQEIQQTLHTLCGRWFSTDYGILWAWLALDGQTLWVSRETCDGRGFHIGKISVSKKWLPPQKVARIWRTQRIVMDIDVPGFGRQTSESFVMIQGSTPSGMVLWRAVRTTGSTSPVVGIDITGTTVSINTGPDTYMIWDFCTASAIMDTLKWWQTRAITMALDIEVRTLRMDLTQSFRSIALCTATKNRLWQLRHTLVPNLVAMWPHRGWVRYYIADFGSTDNTIDFILNTCQPFIRQGMLKVYMTPEHTLDECRSSRMDGHYWHASICKNAIHTQAVEDILVNFDGDNLMGYEFPLHVDDQFQQGAGVVHYSNRHQGTYGCIAYYRADFEYIRGYDEDAFPMGSQDADIIERLVKLGKVQKNVKDSELVKAIPNTIEDKTTNIVDSRVQSIPNIAPLYGSLKWERMNNLNWEIFTNRTKVGQLVRNLDKRTIGSPLALVHAVVDNQGYLPPSAPRGSQASSESSPIDADAWRLLAKRRWKFGGATVFNEEPGSEPVSIPHEGHD